MARKIGFSVAMVLALVLLASCGKDAQKAIDEAQTAVNAARDAGADQYAPDEYKSAEELLTKAKGEYDGRDYKPAQADALSSKNQADLARQRALDRKAAEAQTGKPAETTTAYNVSSLGEQPVPEDQAKAALKDIHFSFDSADLDEAAKQALVGNAKWLSAHPEIKLVIEGHCDERGSEDYNLALGERRAKAVRDYLVSLGVEPGSLSIISYGETMPLDPGHDETAWAKNRRAHFAIAK